MGKKFDQNLARAVVTQVQEMDEAGINLDNTDVVFTMIRNDHDWTTDINAEMLARTHYAVGDITEPTIEAFDEYMKKMAMKQARLYKRIKDTAKLRGGYDKIKLTDDFVRYILENVG